MPGGGWVLLKQHLIQLFQLEHRAGASISILRGEVNEAQRGDMLAEVTAQTAREPGWTLAHFCRLAATPPCPPCPTPPPLQGRRQRRPLSVLDAKLL